MTTTFTTTLAFTIGRTKSYDEALAKDPDDVWKGEGGWIFKTQEDAEGFLKRNQGKVFDDGGFTLDETFSIYGLELTDAWEDYVGDDPPNPERAYRLIRTAQIVKL